MKDINTKTGISLSAAGALLIACIPCCAAVVVPLLAWIGVTSAVAIEMGLYLGAGILLTAGLGILLVHARRRAKQGAACSRSGACGCNGPK